MCNVCIPQFDLLRSCLFFDGLVYISWLEEAPFSLSLSLVLRLLVGIDSDRIQACVNTVPFYLLTLKEKLLHLYSCIYSFYMFVNNNRDEFSLYKIITLQRILSNLHRF